MKVEFGVCLPNFGNNLSVEGVKQVAVEAEEMGFDSVWATDHLLLPKTQRYPYGNIFEALTVMAFAAAVTEEVKIGSSVIVLPMREPIQVAKALAAIDHLSGGRVIAGFGAGWCEEEFSNLGMNFHNRGKRFNEELELIKTLWRGGEVTYGGRYYSIKSGVFEPRPVKGMIPIWVGGNSLKALQRALKYGDGWHFTGMPVENVNSVLSIAEAREGFVFSGRLTVDFTGKAPRITKAASGEPRAILSGDVDYVSEMIDRYVEARVNYFVLYFGDKPADQYINDMNLFTRDVAPSYV